MKEIPGGFYFFVIRGLGLNCPVLSGAVLFYKKGAPNVSDAPSPKREMP
jgi:hypothetical protein